MSRKRKRPYVGCSLGTTSGGKLRFVFRAPRPGWPGVYQYAETTALDDTPDNRRRLEPICQQIGAEIRARTFSYLRWFPLGHQAAAWTSQDRHPETANTKAEAATVQTYYDRWLPRKAPPTVAASTYRDYKGHFRAYILPTIGDVELKDLTRLHLEDLRLRLRQRGLCEKTLRNAIGGSLRAMIRDAMDDGLIEKNPFAVFRWQRIEVAGPDPHTAEERDRILAWVRTQEFRGGRGEGRYEKRTHYAFFAAVHTLYFTGMRPSELTALKIRDVELGKNGAGRLFVRSSRVLRREGPTKTARSMRIVAIDEATCAIIATLIPLHADSAAYLFRAPEGGPIDQDKLNRIFCNAERALGIRIRGLYATKDTFCSLYLSRKGRLEWLSEQTGVAEGTLRRHYALYLRTSSDDAAELARLTKEAMPATDEEIVAATGTKAKAGAKKEAKTAEIVTRVVTRKASVQPSMRKGGRRKMEQKGFEPVAGPRNKRFFRP